jgi:hypothetical protein
MRLGSAMTLVSSQHPFPSGLFNVEIEWCGRGMFFVRLTNGHDNLHFRHKLIGSFTNKGQLVPLNSV